MNLINRIVPKNEKIQLQHTNPELIHKLSNRVVSWIPNQPRELIILCIGTDRSTGDALGPFTGFYLADKKTTNFSIYGTLPEPVHATNLKHYIKLIELQHTNPFIIAVDASLGKSDSVGDIIGDTGALRPGAALQKDLPAIGDVHITGVVNISGFMEYAVLQSTRLSLVVEMAKSIADVLSEVDQQISFKRSMRKRFLEVKQTKLGVKP